MNEIREGMKVQLISGGPDMAVSKIVKDPDTGQLMAWCQWFETVKGKQTAKGQSFPVTVLKPA